MTISIEKLSSLDSIIEVCWYLLREWLTFTLLATCQALNVLREIGADVKMIEQNWACKVMFPLDNRYLIATSMDCAN